MAKSTGAKGKPQRAAVFEQDSDDSDAGSLQLESGSELGSDLEGSEAGSDVDQDEEEEEEEEEEGRSKYAQFMDDSDLESGSDDSQSDASQDDDEVESEAASSAYGSDDDAGEDDLQQQMKQIPFSALVKARQQMDGSASDDDDDSELDISDLEEDEFAQDRQRLAQAKAGKQPQRSSSSSRKARSSDTADETLEQKRREVRERLRQLNGNGASTSNDTPDDAWAQARKQREERRHAELSKRTNKNAPTEISSKRPVSRRRTVIETSASHVRDPRFESLSGSVNKDLFSKSYSFLPEMFSSELTTLKQTLAKLKKQEAAQAGPKAKSEAALAIREERAKVEAALRRAEGLAGERERRARESAVKGRIKAQNKERVEKGLLPFYPKKSEVKQMLLKDKYDRLAGGNEEGKRASGQEKKQLKKALERRRRKNAQKEKRDMPVGIGFAREGNAAIPKRKRTTGGGGGEGSKRARF